MPALCGEWLTTLHCRSFPTSIYVVVPFNESLLHGIKAHLDTILLGTTNVRAGAELAKCSYRTQHNAPRFKATRAEIIISLSYMKNAEKFICQCILA